MKTTKKTASRISDKVKKRIIEVALQNPDFGARRLIPILKRRKINVSSSQIYSVLKRNNLQTREKRHARLEEQNSKSKTPPAKPTAKIAPEIHERIVEVSLQHPDFGAKRLLPLLKKDKISISASSVYGILKRNGLQSRERRLAVIEARRSAEAAPTTEKAAAKITPEAEKRVIEVSLQHPDYGVRRLAGLLAAEGIPISSSEIYTLLRRHSLQTRSLRLLELERQNDAEIPPPPEAEVPVSEDVDVVAIPIESPAVPTTIARPAKSRYFIFYLVNLLLLALIGYLGFLAVQNVQKAQMEPKAVDAGDPTPVRTTVKSEIAAQPLEDYRSIWERNLFNVAEEKSSVAKEEIAIKKLALADKDLGLDLVGTVVSEDSNMSLAIIDNRKTRDQEAYREGDTAGDVRIKKIFRSKVVITTDEGDELLTIDVKKSGKAGTALRPQRSASKDYESPFLAAGSQLPVIRRGTLSLKREDVEKSLADLGGLMEEINISPNTQDGQPSGFRISNIPRQSILRKMGLRNRDVITDVNDQPITGPEQAAQVFEKLSQGGEISINITRRGRSRKINLNIE